MAFRMDAEDILVKPIDMANTLVALASLYRFKLAKERHVGSTGQHPGTVPGEVSPVPTLQDARHGRGGHPGDAHGLGGQLDGVGGLVQGQVGQGQACRQHWPTSRHCSRRSFARTDPPGRPP